MTDTLRTRHTVSGAIDENTPRHIYEHVVLGQYLEEVGPNAKPFNPETHKPRKASPDQRPADEDIAAAGLAETTQEQPVTAAGDPVGVTTQEIAVVATSDDAPDTKKDKS